jgi:hypothetical protein
MIDAKSKELIALGRDAHDPPPRPTAENQPF